MPSVGLLLLGAAAGLFAVLRPPRQVFVVLVSVIVLVPGTLPIPNGVTSYLSFHNVVIAGAVLALVRGVREGWVRSEHLRVTPSQTALTIFCIVVLVNGVALAGPSTVLNDLQQGIVAVLAQLVVLTVGIVLVRVIDDHRFVIATLAGALVTSAAIAAVERLSGHSFGEFLFRHLHLVTDAAQPLVEAAGRPRRVRAGAQFALQFGWSVVMFAPALLVVPTFFRGRRSWWLVAPLGLTAAALYWSYTRSAIALAPVAVVLVWVGTRWNRRITTVIAVGAFAVLAMLTARPTVTAALRPEADQGSIDSRTERLPLVGEAVAGHSVQGIGLGGLKQLGVSATDASYVQVYAETGVLGLAAFVVAILVALMSAGRGLLAAPGPHRVLATVGFSGAVMGVLGSGAFDLFAIRNSAEQFWLLIAVGIVGAERCRGALPPIQRPTAARAAWPAIGLVLGLVLFFGVPERATSTVRFLVAPTEAEVRDDPGLLGDRILGHTACDIADHFDFASGERAVCRELRRNRGVWEVRFEADDPDAVRRIEAAVFERIEVAVPGARQRSESTEPVRFRSTGSRTAPIWATWLGLELALLLPGAAVRSTVRRWDRDGWMPLAA